MNRLLGLAPLTWLLSFGFAQAAVVTAYYQPTPYPPRFKSDGSAMPQNIEIVHIWNGWVANNGPTFVQDGQLKIGGQGDVNRAYIQFDITGLPAKVSNAILWLMPSTMSTATRTPYEVCRLASPWDPNNWKPSPILSSCTNWTAAPTPGVWSYAYITDSYAFWKVSATVNHGVAVLPQYSSSTVDSFRSSRFADYVADPFADGHRPVLQLDFTTPPGMPNFKMPVPGDYKWLLSNEIGGYECMGKEPWPDIYHQDATGNYYSIDISWDNKYSKVGPTPYGQLNTPVLAAAGGKVIIPTDPQQGDAYPNGNYIVIDHDGDGKLATGLSTRYLHLKDAPKRKDGTPLKTGDIVAQGDQIGIMGTTGHAWDSKHEKYVPTSTGVHVHFAIRYQDKGFSYTEPLSYVMVDGWLMKSFQTECLVNSAGVPTSWNRYYLSTNYPTQK